MGFPHLSPALIEYEWDALKNAMKSAERIHGMVPRMNIAYT